MSLADVLGFCPTPLVNPKDYPDGEGFIDGRLCQQMPGQEYSCCLPCPLTDWVYPDSFDTITEIANWLCVASAAGCIFLLLSWIFLPVDKTNRHYLSIGLTCAVMVMNLGFVVPLAQKPDQCMNKITPHDMHSSPGCGIAGSFLLFGGFAGVMWTFMRAVSLHLQICWQVVVGKKFMLAAQAIGWGIPVVILAVALAFSGVSFRFGATCHINHENSLATFWIPILAFAGITAIFQFATFGYCLKVYLASLADNSTSTEGSGLPSYNGSVRTTMTPRQAYRRVKRVIALQWRGITIVLIIVADVIFFSIIFVFQDVTVHRMKQEDDMGRDWVKCLLEAGGDKNQCLDKTKDLVVGQATITAVLVLLAINGIWLVLFLGRWSMVIGWIDLFKSFFGGGSKNSNNMNEFVSVDARKDTKQDTRAYEMLSKDTSSIITPIDSVKSPMSPMDDPNDGRFHSYNNSHDYFGQTARYHTPSHSFSTPRPPQSPPPPHHSPSPQSPQPTWDPRVTHARPDSEGGYVNPLGMHRTTGAF